MTRSLLTAALVAATLLPASARAFCGFYVAGGGAQLFNNATQVVLMREGTRTVLSMQNNYQGPPEAFAMVVPVPVILQEANVKTLPRAIFDKVEQLSAPRLVEYWEQDPCWQPKYAEMEDRRPTRKSAMAEAAPSAAPRAADYGVTVEAQFAVGEYEIVILSAKDALGLDNYLRDSKYRIPQGAEALFRPYIQQGMKFFVAKVDPKKVKFENGMATLSPLRFHYDSESFALPVRLGLINAKDKQDLIVHILARGQRYEVANYPNVTIPTNIDLAESARSEFGPFYASLYDMTLKRNPKAVVTEYSWDSASCDPCPTPPLQQGELMTLGMDVLNGSSVMPEIEVKNLDKLDPQDRQWIEQGITRLKSTMPSQRQRGMPRMVLTRLHARYDKSSLGEDLIFKAAPGIAGGREFMRGQDGLEQGAQPSGVNMFQGRYAIRHEWKGPIACSNPVRGRWGGPPSGTPQQQATAATNTVFAPRDPATVQRLAESPVAEVDVKGRKAHAGLPRAAK